VSAERAAVRLDRAAKLAFLGRLTAAAGEIDRAEPFLEPAGRATARWLRSYLAAARGDFREAERGARLLLRRHAIGPAADARPAITLGSVLRQTNRHAEAREVERAALRRTPAGEARTHLLIGLAADAVGLGDLRAVDAALDRVGRRPSGGWRAGVRLDWVRCERELLAGHPEAAAGRGRRALERSRRAGAKRHEAKSLLFLGAALSQVAPRPKAGAPASREAERALRRARTIASRLGAGPIAEVAGELLGRLERRL